MKTEKDRTHGGNHAPLLNGGLLSPGFCDGCDYERERGCRACRILASGTEGSTEPHTCLSHVFPPGKPTDS